MRSSAWCMAFFVTGVFTGAAADSASFPVTPDIRYSQTARGVIAPVLAVHDDASPDMNVAQFKAAPPPGKIVRLTGYMVGAYLCPPCPPGAMCKPCMSHSSIAITDELNHIQDAPEIILAVPDPAPFKRGVRYRFEIAADADGGLDGRILRSQPAREPAWPSP